MKRSLLTVVLVVVAVAGCSGDPEPPAPSDAPTTSVAATPAASPSDAATPSATDGASGASGAPVTPASSCLTGRYRLARFVGAGANNTYGTGQGGDVTLSFDGGKYTMAGKGKDPITVTLAGQSAPLVVDGTVNGSYRGTGEEVTFTRGKATGSGTVTAGGDKRTLTMTQISNVLAPNGPGQLSCTADQLTIILEDVRLELTK